MKPTTAILESLLRGQRPEEILSRLAPIEIVRAAAETVWTIPVRVLQNAAALSFGLLMDSWAETRVACALIEPSHPCTLAVPFGDVGLLAQAEDVMGDHLDIPLRFELAGIPSPKDVEKWRLPKEFTLGHHGLNGVVRLYATDGQRALIGYYFGRHYMLVELANITPFEETVDHEIESKGLEEGTKTRKPRTSSVSLAMDLLG